MPNAFVYRHYDAGGRLLYVGMTLKPIQRLEYHRYTSSWVGEIRTIKIQPCANRGEAIAFEREAIRNESPLFNFAVIEAARTPLTAFQKVVSARVADSSTGEVARQCGVSKSLVSHWMSGKRRPPLEKMSAIAKVLGVTEKSLKRGL
jgi:DNA-binding transcriptional regulator YiaG